MAKNDTSTTEEYAPVTAQDAVAVNADNLSADDQKPVAENYESALGKYEARSDVEPLEARRARESGTSFSDADFVRAAQREGEGRDPGTGVVFDAPSNDVKGVSETAGPGVVPEKNEKK